MERVVRRSARATAAVLFASSLTFAVHGSVSAATSAYHSIAPLRIVDTRSGLGVASPGQTVAGVATVVALVGDVASAAGVALNVTVTEPSGPGFATVYPCGNQPPLASNVNFAAAQTVPNAVIAAPGAGAAVCVVTSVPAQLVIDLEGWFPAGSYVPSSVPVRVLDTRSDPSLGLRPGVENVLVHNASGAAAVANVTATNARASGYLVVYPCGTTPPLASNLNFVPGESVANLVVAHPGTNGDICAMASAATDVVVDIQGQITDAAGYTSISPVRMADTRSPIGVPVIGRTTPGQTIELSFPEQSGIPSVVDTAVANVTATDAVGGGYVTVYPCDQPIPLASNINIEPGDTRPNLVLVKLGTGGTICVTVNIAAHIVVDLQGWFAGSTPTPPPSPPARQHVDVGHARAVGYLAYLPPGYTST
ncbi:MAG: hypothetical protein JWN39_4364, partial [Ilumatobacteraceae bacterium]|nr:hypothetical protein [Ilumatobacteraceae bacterium]